MYRYLLILIYSFYSFSSDNRLNLVNWREVYKYNLKRVRDFKVKNSSAILNEELEKIINEKSIFLLRVALKQINFGSIGNNDNLKDKKQVFCNITFPKLKELIQKSQELNFDFAKDFIEYKILKFVSKENLNITPQGIRSIIPFFYLATLKNAIAKNIKPDTEIPGHKTKPKEILENLEIILNNVSNIIIKNKLEKAIAKYRSMYYA